jgi:Protein of unknown function (DUF4239)
MQTGILVVETLGVILIVLLGLYLVRRIVGVDKLKSNHELAGFLIGIVGTIYAVLLAFVVVVEWQKHTDASNTVATEANVLGDLSRMAERLPSEQRKQVLSQLVDYAQSVANDEWPMLASGNSSDKTTRLLNQIWKNYVTDQNPQTAAETALYSESLRRLNELSDSRRLRINSSRDGLSSMLWVVLIGGGMVTLAFTYFFGAANLRAQLLMVAALTGEIAFILILIVLLDNPYRGELKVTPDPIREQADHIGGRILKGGF